MINVPLVNGLGKTKGVEEAGNKVWKGDLEKIDFGEKDLIEINDLIYNKSFKEFGAGKVCFLGGDHSMSYPITRAFFDWCENESKKPCLIVFDAHPDLMEPVDRKIPTHEEWLRGLVEDGFPVENILLVGVRNIDVVEKKYLQEKGIKRMSVEELMFNLETKSDAIMEFGYGKEVYVSIDIDVVDPAYAPGTGYLEPGGISSRELLYVLRRISKMKNLRAIDLVEINPSCDFNDMTSRLGEKIINIFY